MKSKFLFFRKKDTFIWAGEYFRIEFSNPSIDLFEDAYAKCREPEEILYYTYTLRIFSKKWCKTRYRWYKVAETSIYDFPCIQELLNLIKWYLGKQEPDESWCHYFIGKEYETYSITCNTESPQVEDYYEITKYTRPLQNKEWFSLYVGCATNPQGTTGIFIDRLYRGELIQLKRCIEHFIHFTMEAYNHDTEQRNLAACNSHKYVGGKLYNYSDSITPPNVITNIYAVGDVLNNIDILQYKKNYFYSEQYYDETIAQITEQELIMESGKRFSINSILSLSAWPSKEMLCYNQAQITADLMACLNDLEKDDFRKLTLDELYEKYGKAIDNRTRMHRDEHSFPQIHENRFENVRQIIYNVIDEIKQLVSRTK